MKINADIRAVVRSAEALQKKRSIRVERQEVIKQAAKALLRNRPEIAQRLARAREINKAIKKLSKEKQSIYNRFGLHESGSVYDEDSFKRAGGKIPDIQEPWRYDKVIMELAAAPPHQLHSILAKYGIRWE